ncbi:hypothetical protein OC846_000123 [Tilletia horrida]|uniref:CCHC-type domain-containing protein n=1 Tax=Tilletia horrida TaxID=155126 RepID=A0AAN6GY91_9BASI|nr:hypothetical protein OC845_002368 [Tilletia horrida]KAK0557829.1 hypothetical protein OC846_000123 [Tilletia horrida]
MTRYTKLEGRKPTAAKVDSKSLFDEAVEKKQADATTEEHTASSSTEEQPPPSKKIKLDSDAEEETPSKAPAPITKTAKLKRIKLLKLKCKKAKTPEKRMELRREIAKLEKELNNKDPSSQSNASRSGPSDSGWPRLNPSSDSPAPSESTHTNPWKAMEAERRAKSEARRLQRIAERTSAVTCFACRGTGHSAKDCPNAFNANAADPSSIPDGGSGTAGKDVVGHCFRCNSTSHILARCPAKRKRDDDGTEILPYATCFVCSQQGHIAAACPQNAEKGVYPKGGGACGFCQSVRHRARDCPTRLDSAKEEEDAADELRGEVQLDGEAIVRRRKPSGKKGSAGPVTADPIRKKVVSF